MIKNSDAKRILKKVNEIASMLDEEDFIYLEKDEKGHLVAGIECALDYDKIDIEKAINVLYGLVKDVTY